MSVPVPMICTDFSGPSKKMVWRAQVHANQCEICGDGVGGGKGEVVEGGVRGGRDGEQRDEPMVVCAGQP